MEYLQYSNLTNIWTQIQFLVLNLVINGIPSIQHAHDTLLYAIEEVLNLVINGIPSIRDIDTKNTKSYGQKF